MNDLGLILLILGGIAFLLMLGAAFGDWYDAKERRDAWTRNHPEQWSYTKTTWYRKDKKR